MTIKLNIRHLQVIKQVSNVGSVSEAANRLGVTQSALSHRIREAERLLGTILFYRKNKKLVPSNAGKRLLSAAKVVLGEMERAENDIDKLSDGIEYIVRIGAEVYCSYHWLPGFLLDFQESHSSIGIEVIADVSLDPITALRHSIIDLTIISDALDSDLIASKIGNTKTTSAKNIIFRDSTFNVTKLFRDEMVAVLSVNHSLLHDRKWLSPQDFLHETYIAYHTNPERGREYEQVFNRYNLLPGKVIRAGLTDAVIAFVAAGQGITILPKWTVEPFVKNGQVSTKRITEGGIFTHWYAVSRKSEQVDSPAAIFIEKLQKNIG